MAEAAVGATIQVLLENLVTISKEQISLVRHFKNDMNKLQETISMVNGFLHDVEEKKVTDTAVKCWLKELEALAFKADNVFDEINYHILSKKVRPTELNKTMKKKVQSFFSCLNNHPIAYRLKLGRRIKDINEKLKSINQQASEFGLQTRITSAQAPVSGSDASGSTETDSFSVDPIILGRENDVSAIVKMLITEPNPGEQVLSIHPIVGMGGLGKTTLARKVFGDEQIISHFGDNRVWVHVSRNFDVVVLLKNILTSLTTQNVEHGNREALLKKLQTNLGAKKYLMVLDDIWNEDREKWDDFVKSLSGINTSPGNFLIVTTRSELVASIVGTLPVHKLKGLSEDDCWSIIKDKAFRGGDSPLEFEAMGKYISKKCHGLPLAAKVVGGILLGKSRDEWVSIKNNWLSGFGDENPISKILKLSFDNLSSPSLKKCFAYCSIFPKGYQIEKEILVELWMAEGFLQTDHQRSNINMETNGCKFVNILLQNSLLQVARKDGYGNVTHCNMHDLVHDLSCSILHENDNVTDGVCQSRYIGWKSSGDELFPIPKGHEKFVRTLFFKGRISDIEFSNFESLHSLTLSGRDIDVLPNSIGELKHLRYLDISETSIEYLPNSISELYHLQTLRTMGRFYNYLEKLPDSFSNLISLRHLHIVSSTTLPPEIGKLTSLQTLPYFHVGSEKGYRISELGNLKDLRGKLKVRNLENVSDKYEAMSVNLSQKTNIYELSFRWGEVDEEANDDESVLEGLQPHPDLKSLSIRGFKGKTLPQWTLKMAVQLDGRCCSWEGLENLMEIRLKDCTAVVELPMLGHLPHLKSLYLRRLENVRSIGPSFYNIKDCSKSRTSSNTIVVFRTLEKLELLKMPNLIEWAEVDCPLPNELVVFPRLKYLCVQGCTQLKSAPSHFPCLEMLDIRRIDSSLPLKSIFGMKLTSLRSLTLSNIQGLECLPDGLFSDNRDLSWLNIWSCPKLRELPANLHILDSLEVFCVIGCPLLKSIPYSPPKSEGGGQQQPGFSSLRILKIQDCVGLTNLPVEMVESCAPSLERLILDGMSSITNLGMVIGCVHRMPNLEDLFITNVPKFSIKQQLDGNITGSLRTNNKLSKFEMSPFPDDSSWDNASYNETVDAILSPQVISLRTLELSGMEHWECLPDQLQHLNALERLTLSGFGIEELPEWFGKLTSLEKLYLGNCKRLRHLPSKQAMLRLSKLTTLHVSSCPLLSKEKRNKNDDNSSSSRRNMEIVDSECPKISHIGFVEIR